MIWTALDGTARLDSAWAKQVRLRFDGAHAAYRELVPLEQVGNTRKRVLEYAFWRKAFKLGALPKELLEQIVNLVNSRY